MELDTDLYIREIGTVLSQYSVSGRHRSASEKNRNEEMFTILSMKDNTKFIPYNLFLDMKDILDYNNFFNNRVSICITENRYGMRYLDDFIVKEFIQKIGPLYDHWTYKAMEEVENIRIEMMFSSKEDFEKMRSYIVMEKLKSK